MRIINAYSESVPPDNPRTVEEILDLCCADVTFDICAKSGRVSTYTSAEKEDWDFDPDAALEQARADNPGKRILSVQTEGIGSPPGQPCGKKYEKWTGKNNCCDLVEPMSWDYDNSVEVLAPGTSGIVFVNGGAPPYHWSVRGEGMTLDGYNMRDGFTDHPYVRIFAGPFACGWSPITVTDGCSIVAGGVRSTEGKWSGAQYFYDISGCKIGGIAEESGNTWGTRQFIKISGKWKQTITAEFHWFYSGAPCLPDSVGPVCGGDLSSYIAGTLASFCTGKVPINRQVWCFENMLGGARAEDPYGCCNPTLPRVPANLWCDKTIDSWTNEWVC